MGAYTRPCTRILILLIDAESNFHQGKRRSQTHESKTDKEA